MQTKPPKRECFDSTVQHADWGEKWNAVLHPEKQQQNYAFVCPKEKEEEKFLFLTFCVIW